VNVLAGRLGRRRGGGRCGSGRERRWLRLRLREGDVVPEPLEERGVARVAPEGLDQRFDRLRLIAAGLEFRDELEHENLMEREAVSFQLSASSRWPALPWLTADS